MPGSHILAVAFTKDGKIVVAGSAALALALARYNADGSLDGSFNSGGKLPGTLVTDLNQSSEKLSGHGLIVQNDNKIVVTGIFITSFPQVEYFIARYMAEGSLDSSFNPNPPSPEVPGVVIGTFGGTQDYANGIALSHDATYLIVGKYANNTTAGFGLARYLPNGKLDYTFNPPGNKIPGIVVTIIEGGSAANSVVLQDDGRFIVTGSAIGANGTKNYCGTARYLNNGTLDASFNPGGKQPGITVTLFGQGESGKAVTLDHYGNILIGGGVNVEDTPYFVLLNYIGNSTDYDWLYQFEL